MWKRGTKVANNWTLAGVWWGEGWLAGKQK